MSAHDLPGLSRRRFLTASAAGLGAASVARLAGAAGGSSARAAGTALGGVDLTDAVLEAFQTHRLVGLGEAEGLQNHHDLLELLLTDPRVPEVVDDIVVEFGNALYQPMIDRFIAGEPVDNVDLRPVWRNTTQSPASTWDQPVYEQFYRTVRAVNSTLPPAKQMRVLLGDPPIDWSKITTASQVFAFQAQRDSHAASVVEKEVLGKGHRALLCYGAGHFFHSISSDLVSIIERQTGERTYTIFDLVPSAGDPGGLARILSPYARNTVIPTAGTWLASFDMGFIPPYLERVTKGGKPGGKPTKPTKPPKGGKLTNPWCGTRLGPLVDAGLYYGQPEVLTASWWNPAIYLDRAYWKELQRRNALQLISLDLDSYRQEQPAPPLLKIPRSAECKT